MSQEINLSLSACFEIWKEKIKEKIQHHPLEIISWEATRGCDLKCTHCGSPSETWSKTDELNTKEVIDAFYQIAKDFDLSKFRHINITGGEPFIRKDLVEILKEISAVPEYRNIAIQTNGTYIAKNPSVLEALKNTESVV